MSAASPYEWTRGIDTFVTRERDGRARVSAYVAVGDEYQRLPDFTREYVPKMLYMACVRRAKADGHYVVTPEYDAVVERSYNYSKARTMYAMVVEVGSERQFYEPLDGTYPPDLTEKESFIRDMQRQRSEWEKGSERFRDSLDIDTHPAYMGAGQ